MYLTRIVALRINELIDGAIAETLDIVIFAQAGGNQHVKRCAVLLWLVELLTGNGGEIQIRYGFWLFALKAASAFFELPDRFEQIQLIFLFTPEHRLLTVRILRFILKAIEERSTLRQLLGDVLDGGVVR